MKIKKNLTEAKLVIHPGKFEDSTTFLDSDGNPYDLIPCDPTELATKSNSRKSKKLDHDLPSEMEIDDDSDDDDDEWIDTDTYNPYDDEDDEEDLDFSPDEIKETEIDIDDPSDDSADDDMDDSFDDESDDSYSDDEAEGMDKKAGGKKDGEFGGDEPNEPPTGPISKGPNGKTKLIKGTLLDAHTFRTTDGRIIKI